MADCAYAFCILTALRVLIAADRPFIAEALAALLRVDRRLNVRCVAQWSDAPYFAPVDVVIADIDLFNARLLLGRLPPEWAFVHLSRHSPPTPLQRAEGASVTLPRDTSGQALIEAACDIAVKGCHSNYVHGVDAGSVNRAWPLSAREIEVLRLLAAGYTQSQIAAALGIGTKSVQTYRARAADKLMLRTRVDLVLYAQQQGWLG